MDEKFLINIHRILVIIRYDINNTRNGYLILSIIKCVNEEKSNEILIKLLNEEICIREQLVLGNGNICNNTNNIKEFVLDVLRQVELAFISQNYSLAYDMVDLLHVLPEILLNSDRRQLKNYWKIYIKNFSKKWKNNFDKEYKKYFV